MSFGRPGTFDNFKVTPPARGSFPLDHYGECKDAMVAYLKCVKLNGGDNGKCRPESRSYLECRMDKGLMQRDDMQNLGLGDVASHRDFAAPVPIDPSPSTTPTTTAPEKKRAAGDQGEKFQPAHDADAGRRLV